MRRWQQLVSYSDEYLAALDVAEVHLACAVGLTGADRIDPEFCLRWLDDAAGSVRQYTEKALPQFHRKPHDYENSEAYFRVLCLVTVLQRDLGVRFNPAKIGLPPDAPYDLEDEFIHGAIRGPGGTCATMPVVYAAVGRRLGYPIKLATTKRHLFARWEDKAARERFNIEASNRGLECFPDDHYRRWPVPIDAEEERAFGYLKSLAPREELASFMASRGFCLCDQRLYRHGLDALAWASVLDPDNARYASCVLAGLGEWKKYLQSLYPPGFPRRIEILVCRDPRRFPAIPWEVEREIRNLEAVEGCLFDTRYEEWWWRPLRNGQQPLREVPTSLTVDLTGV